MFLTFNRKWMVFITLMVGLLLPHLATAENGNEFSTAHLEAAERLVYAMGMYESLTIPTRKVLQQMRTSDPATADLMAAVVEPFIDKEYIGHEFRVFMASQFDMETCRQLSEHWEGPIGRRFVDTQVQLLTTGKARPLKFTQTEEAIAKRFEKTPAFLAFARAMPAIEARLAAFGKEIEVKMAARMKEELVRRKEN